MLIGKQILYICEYGTLNGGERSLLAWLPYVLQARCQVRALSPSPSPFASALRELGIRVRAWRKTDDNSETKLPALRRQVQKVVTTLRPDMIHANSLSMSRLVGPVAAELSLPSIGHLRDIVGISRQAMADVNANTRLLAVSQATANWHLAAGLRSERTQVLYNGVDVNSFSPREPTRFLHRELKLPSDARLLGAIGQIGMRKGLDVLLRAMRIVMREASQPHLLIVGERNSSKGEAIQFEQQLHRHASQLPLAGRVHYLGYRSDVPELLNELTLLIHAARQEPLGRVLLEGGASGVPIVATDVGGTGEIFPHGEAVLVSPDDEAGMAEAVMRLLRDPVLRNMQARSVRDAIVERLEARVCAQNLLGHYSALL